EGAGHRDGGARRARKGGPGPIAANRRLARERKQNRQRGKSWKEQAGRLQAHGRESLARRALARKIEHDDLVRALEPQQTAARQSSIEVKTALRALEARLAEARRKQRFLLAQHHAIRLRHAGQRAGRTYFNCQPRFAKFERLENRLADLNDELQAQIEVARGDGDLEAALSELETTRRIDEELAALKTP